MESNTYQFEVVDVSAAEYEAAWRWINPDITRKIEFKDIGTKAAGNPNTVFYGGNALSLVFWRLYNLVLK